MTAKGATLTAEQKADFLQEVHDARVAATGERDRRLLAALEQELRRGIPRWLAVIRAKAIAG